MLIKQISVFVENKFGRLSKIAEVLKSNGIDIKALSLADTSDFGVLRIIVDNPDLAKKVLSESGVTVKSTDVVSVALKNSPGGLSEVLEKLAAEGITVEYMYAFVGSNTNEAQMIVKTDDLEKTVKILG